MAGGVQWNCAHSRCQDAAAVLDDMCKHIGFTQRLIVPRHDRRLYLGKYVRAERLLRIDKAFVGPTWIFHLCTLGRREGEGGLWSTPSRGQSEYRNRVEQ